jgi:hypothetical protein
VSSGLYAAHYDTELRGQTSCIQAMDPDLSGYKYKEKEENENNNLPFLYKMF